MEAYLAAPESGGKDFLTGSGTRPAASAGQVVAVPGSATGPAPRVFRIIGLQPSADDGHVEASVDRGRLENPDHLLVLFAGQAAARRWLIAEQQLDEAALIDVVNGAARDLADAQDDGWTTAAIAAALATADAFADRHWGAVQGVADLPLARGALTGRDLSAALPDRAPTTTETLNLIRAAVDAARIEALSVRRAEARWTMIGSIAGVISTGLALAAVIVAILIR